MAVFFAKTTDDLPAVAEGILSQSGNSRIFAFYGEMGAGKTSLIVSLMQVLGVSDRVSSPTYSLVNEYQTSSGRPVYHFDFYRIKTVEEVYDIGYEDYFYGGDYCFIEWPEKIGELLPEEAVKIVIELKGTNRQFRLTVPE